LATKANIQQVRYDAEEVFRIGGFYCSEAIVSAIRKNFDPAMPEALIAAASGFPVGVGKSKCMCGAISGAVIALGYFFGNDGGKAVNAKVTALSHELQESFRKNHQGTLCCHIHIKGMDITTGQHKKQCVAFTGECAEKAAEIIVRELAVRLAGDDVEAKP